MSVSVCLNAPTSITLPLRDSKQNANKRERDAGRAWSFPTQLPREKGGLGLFSSKVPAAVMPEGFWLLGRNPWPPFQLLVPGNILKQWSNHYKFLLE